MQFRKAVYDDMELLYRWSNDPSVRRNSFHNHKIDLEEHIRWFKKKLADPNCLFLIGMINGAPVGQIRVDVEDLKAVISFMVSEENRGKGFGSCLIKGVVEACRKEYPGVKTIIGQVKKDNIASQKAFIKSGFSVLNIEEIYEYVLEVK